MYERPPFILNQVTNADFRNVDAQKMPPSPLFVLDNVNNFSIKNSKGLKDTQIKQAKHQSL